MPLVNTGADAVRLILQRTLPTTPLPPLVPLKDDTTWRTHTSYVGATHYPFEAPDGEAEVDYERLEHVGDALLGSEVTLLTHERYPRLVVGVRSLVKASLVSNSTLSLISVALGLPPRLLAASAQSFNLRKNPHIQACIFESYLASVHDEHGPVVLRKFLRAIYDPILPSVVEGFRPFHTNQREMEATINYVGLLMEWKMQKGFAGSRMVDFSQERNTGKDEATWTVSCQYSDDTKEDLAASRITTGAQSTVQRAKNEAAAHACKDLGLV